MNTREIELRWDGTPIDRAAWDYAMARHNAGLGRRRYAWVGAGADIGYEIGDDTLDDDAVRDGIENMRELHDNWPGWGDGNQCEQ